jgi:protein-disulfide isomerase
MPPRSGKQPPEPGSTGRNFSLTSIHRQDIDALLIRTDRYARGLGLQGTPGLLINQYAMFGAVDLATLKSVVAKARQNH